MKITRTAYSSVKSILLGAITLACAAITFPACNALSGLLPNSGSSPNENPAESELAGNGGGAGNVPPTAVAGDDATAQVGETLVFDASASFDPDGEIAAYHWDFGDGESAALAVIDHAFQTAGVFAVSLTVTDDQGAIGSTTRAVSVREPIIERAEFELAITVQPPGAGTVAIDPPGGIYEDGQLVRLTIEPWPGYSFLRFEGDVFDTDPTIEVLMDRDREITAVFTRIEVAVFVDVEPPGTGDVVLDPLGGVYDFGTTVTMTANASPGFTFVGFLDPQGMTVSTATSLELIVVDDVEFIARFRSTLPPQTQVFSLTLGVAPAGAGTVVLDPAGGSYVQGTVVTLTALPAAGYMFSQYAGDAVGAEPVIAIPMDTHKSVTAEFAWNPAVGNPGNLLVTGFVGKNVTEFDRFDGVNLGEAVADGAGGLSLAGGIDIGPTGDIFVVNVGVLNNTSVIRYDASTGAPVGTFVAGTDAVGFLTLRFGPSGDLYVANNASNTIEEYDGTTGAFLRTFVTADSGGLNNPVGLTFGLNGNLFVVSKDTDSILEYDGTTGQFIGTAADLSSSGFAVPVDVVFGADGALYVTTSGDESVARVDSQTGVPAVFVAPGSGGLDSPGGLGFHPDSGNLLVVSQGNNSVLEFDGNTGEFLRVFAVGSDGDNLFFLAFRPR